MSEEEKKIIVEEKPCTVIPEHLKGILDCCEKFDTGEIDAGTFFSESLIETGKFMKIVQERKNTLKTPENTV